MTENEALLVATRLYVRMRANGGRVIDVTWLTQNAEYAHEILRLAAGHVDGEVQRLGARLEELLFGTVQPRSPAPPAPAAATAARETAATLTGGKTPNKYVGVLR
ncbi:hypothetical protein [Solimonas terrae]|uniref:Uncharacterized protein n=1 Tax=Solimonas terrae TaxID=1396819 RepID=A0A6M2BVS6_9GAMM|nr:hypothetical protein [Solimonas terrae]NGY06089.1 hypothetical protein [Solimonas terrae]